MANKTISGLSGDCVKDLNSLEPGQVLRWTLKDGREFAVLAWDDFEHVAGNASMGTKPPPETVDGKHA